VEAVACPRRPTPALRLAPTRAARAGGPITFALLIAVFLYPVGGYGVESGQGVHAGSALPHLPRGVIVIAVAFTLAWSAFIGYWLRTGYVVALAALAVIAVLWGVTHLRATWVDGSGPIIIEWAVAIAVASLIGRAVAGYLAPRPRRR